MSFASLKDKDISHFESIVGRQSGMVTDEEDLRPYNTDWTKKFKGNSKLVLKPETSEQVAAVLKYCN
jgi:D-lactate dehydrogenase (cytochrome)